MKFNIEPAFEHGTVVRTAVLLVNLGSPDAPTPNAVRRYLAEFLSDPRVVEIPALLWKIILHGIILRVRPAKSAAKYAAVWGSDGAPLKVHTEKQAKLLRGYLGEQDVHVLVAYAMRYGQPGIAEVLDALKQRRVERILLLPLYPQYSATTTASVMDAVGEWLARTRNQPEIRSIKHFHDHSGYIEALASSIQDYWQAHGRPQKLLMSFHGVPKRTLTLGDPYHCECYKTARLLSEWLGLQQGQVLVTFQSRFGKAEWLKPYTFPVLAALAKKGVERVDVVCPGFVSDCLETLEEIAIEGKQEFLKHGGKEFHYIPCLNQQDAWIKALADLAQQHLQGWPIHHSEDPVMKEIERTALETSRMRALTRGATN